jgi:DNA-3-methyladenine glycosylase
VPDPATAARAVPGSSGAGLIPRDFLARPAVEVAPDLLGCVLEHETAEGLVAVQLTEVEAYAGPADPASHAYRGMTARNAVMFGEPGHAYVYFTYGMHFCVNVVCQRPGMAEAVLLRAGRVTAGDGLAALRRAARVPRARDLARGPARLCQALAITRAQNDADLCDPLSPLRLRLRLPAGRHDGAPAGTHLAAEPGVTGNRQVATGPRVGVTAAADVPWRFWLSGDPTVSAYRPSKKRAR